MQRKHKANRWSPLDLLSNLLDTPWLSLPSMCSLDDGLLKDPPFDTAEDEYSLQKSRRRIAIASTPWLIVVCGSGCDECDVRPAVKN